MDQVDAYRASTCLLVQRRMGSYKVGNVADVHTDFIDIIADLFDRQGIIQYYKVCESLCFFPCLKTIHYH